MLKRVDEAVFATIEEAKAGNFAAGVKRFGLANKGIDYAVDQCNEKILSAEVRKKADELKAEIIAGKIDVPDYYKQNKSDAPPFFGPRLCRRPAAAGTKESGVQTRKRLDLCTRCGWSSTQPRSAQFGAIRQG